MFRRLWISGRSGPLGLYAVLRNMSACMCRVRGVSVCVCAHGESSSRILDGRGHGEEKILMMLRLLLVLAVLSVPDPSEDLGLQERRIKCSSCSPPTHQWLMSVSL